MAILGGSVGAHYVAWQVVRNLVGLAADMRANAVSYAAKAVAGQSIPSIADLIHADATRYSERIAKVTQYNGVQLFTDAMVSSGLTVQDITDLVTTLTNVTNSQQAFNGTTIADVQTARDNLLAAVPAPLVIW
jgi:hypothetical protein